MRLSGPFYSLLFIKAFIQHAYAWHIAISIKVVLKKREKVKYERKRLVGNDYSFIPEYVTIYVYKSFHLCNNQAEN